MVMEGFSHAADDKGHPRHIGCKRKLVVGCLVELIQSFDSVDKTFFDVKFSECQY